jgi:acyl carrier protein
MEKEEFYLLIDDICDLEEGTIKGDESLQISEFFGSLAMLGLMAMLDKKFNLNINTDDIRKIGTINNLFLKVST